MRKVNANGAVIYRGPSALDGQPIIVVATGLTDPSANDKTGAMIQTWIMPANEAPIAAAKSGADSSVCGDCVHRPALGGDCYVVLFHAPRAIWAAAMRGSYMEACDEGDREALGAMRKVRIGSWGDPSAVPVEVWEQLVRNSEGNTGYTHQWKTAGQLRTLCVASVDSPEERDAAWAIGWRTFRVDYTNGPRARGEAICPGSDEAGKRVKCDGCPIPCNGKPQGAVRGAVVQGHGAKALAKRSK